MDIYSAVEMKELCNPTSFKCSFSSKTFFLQLGHLSIYTQIKRAKCKDCSPNIVLMYRLRQKTLRLFFQTLH